MFWKDVGIPNPIKSNAFFNEPRSQILYTIEENLKKIGELFLASVFDIFFCNGPETAALNTFIEAEFYHFFHAHTSFLVAQKGLEHVLFRPSTIAVHDKRKMHGVYS